MDASSYKHVVLGLIFLKYVDGSFSEHREMLAAELSAMGHDSDTVADLLESRDAYTAAEPFWLPAEARWSYLQSHAGQPDVGRLIDRAMQLVEQSNERLRDVLPRNFGRLSLDQRRLGELIDLIGTIGVGGAAEREADVLGRVYEYFVGRFASAEGKGGGEFYTPRSIVKLLVEMIEPYDGSVYDPCCGSGGMFVQSERFVETHGGGHNDLAVIGQELNDTTWRLAKMNLAICGIDADLGPRWGDSFHDDLHPDLKADFCLSNPPFNISDWGGDRLLADRRWNYGTPPRGNANYAWLQHVASHLSPRGVAGIVLANGSLSSQQSKERAIRRAMVECDLVECIVALPGQLFYATQIPVSLWFLNRDKVNAHIRPGAKTWRDRRSEVLFIDARSNGVLVDRTHRELTEDEIARIASTYHAWRGEPDAGSYEDVRGFCASATTEQIAAQRYVLTPGRFVGIEETKPDGEAILDEVNRLTKELLEAFQESDHAQTLLREALGRLDV